MHRAYCKNLNLKLEFLDITDKEEIHHIKNVLRLKNGSNITIFNGKYEDALCKIESTGQKRITVRILQKTTYKRPNPEIILACAIPKKNKFEIIIEKATELGVNEIIPLKTKRTEVILKGSRANKKKGRFQVIAINAAKQSKQISIPFIHNTLTLSEALQIIEEKTFKIIPSLQRKKKNLLETFKLAKTSDKIAFFIGPEGDFTEDEYALAEANGCTPVTLGNTILKVETAAICSLSCANIFFRS